jgi:hypothetical protein
VEGARTALYTPPSQNEKREFPRAGAGKKQERSGDFFFLLDSAVKWEMGKERFGLFPSLFSDGRGREAVPNEGQ